MTRHDLLFDGEFQTLGRMLVTTPERTAFDLARRGPVGRAVARLDSPARATNFKVSDVELLAGNHRHARGLRQLETVLDLVDAGAASPKETWLRLMLIRAGYPRPQTQIPVLSLDGSRLYYLDWGHLPAFRGRGGKTSSWQWSTTATIITSTRANSLTTSSDWKLLSNWAGSISGSLPAIIRPRSSAESSGRGIRDRLGAEGASYSNF